MLKKLRKKLAARYAGWKRQNRKAEKTGKRGHRKAAKKHRKAIRKLKDLIEKHLLRRKVNWNGHPALSYGPIESAARTALQVPGLYITSTTDGIHSATSWHYKARAFDGGSSSGSEGPEKLAQQRLLEKYGSGHFAELFGPLPWYVKNGLVYNGVFPGHHDHLHVAVA